MLIGLLFSLQECYLENDQTSLYHTAKGLINLQALYGTIPQIYGKGECARVSLKQVGTFAKEGRAAFPPWLWSWR